MHKSFVFDTFGTKNKSWQQSEKQSATWPREISSPYKSMIIRCIRYNMTINNFEAGPQTGDLICSGKIPCCLQKQRTLSFALCYLACTSDLTASIWSLVCCNTCRLAVSFFKLPLNGENAAHCAATDMGQSQRTTEFQFVTLTVTFLRPEANPKD